MNLKKRTILVTSALPYANGPIHIGHLLEYIQTDIWVRFQKLRGHDCHYVCADDTHGTPVMLRARQEGISPEELIETMQKMHQEDFAGFLIEFDCYHSTHSEENRRLSEEIYLKLRDGGHISRRTVRQLYDPKEEIFLPDRFIRGTCPCCQAPDQYGDGCERCNAAYSPEDLINPVSAVSGAAPVERETEHLFFKLPEFTEFLRQWVSTGRLQSEIVNKLDEWFDAGLREWDISRDSPYFGFEIPGETGKFFYVWLDAPVGYLASLSKLCTERGLDYDSYVSKDSDAEMYHFIGKDIMYFHCLFWPAMLQGAGMRMPDAVFAHGFLIVNGQKMSKTRGTFIKARTWLEHLNPEHLRYYFAARLGSGIDDIDLNMEDFVQRVNADLIGKVVNIGSRCAGFISKRFNGRLSENLGNTQLHKIFTDAAPRIATGYEQRDYAQTMRAIMELADHANRYIDRHKPWVLGKQQGKEAELHEVCSMGIELFRLLCLYLKPVLPDMAAKTEAWLGCPPLIWEDINKPLCGASIGTFTPLLVRIDPHKIETMFEASRTDLTKRP
ncbi:MAG: methionine--tRNA ligase [Candidatus Eutrophobiaceae bacterium]